jgi:hypothetical protein
MRKLWIAVAAAALMSALLVAPAEAVPTTRVPSNVTIDDLDLSDYPPTVRLSGHVSSPRPRCERRRLVRVRQMDTGQFVGSDRTNFSGFWEIAFNGDEIPPGHFRVSVTRKVFGIRRHGVLVRRIVCRPDSSDYTVGQ